MANMMDPEQTELYIDTVSIYRQLPSHRTTVGGATDPIWDPVPVLQNIPCFRETQPNFDNVALMGRTDEANVFTSDIMHFPINYDTGAQPLDIRANMLLKLTTPGHPEENKYLEVLGQTTVKRFASNKQRCYVKFTAKPKNFS